MRQHCCFLSRIWKAHRWLTQTENDVDESYASVAVVRTAAGRLTSYGNIKSYFCIWHRRHQLVTGLVTMLNNTFSKTSFLGSGTFGKPHMARATTCSYFLDKCSMFMSVIFIRKQTRWAWGPKTAPTCTPSAWLTELECLYMSPEHHMHLITYRSESSSMCCVNIGLLIRSTWLSQAPLSWKHMDFRQRMLAFARQYCCVQHSLPAMSDT